MSFHRSVTLAAILSASALIAFSQFHAATPAEASIWTDLDPTYVIESDVPEGGGEGQFDSVTVTDDADGDHEVPVLVRANRGKGPYWARVRAEASGFTPGQSYTVRVTGRAAGTGTNWGVYTWLRYRAGEDGKLHINLRLQLPATKAHVGEQIVLAPAVYRAEDIRRDGRPEKVTKTCILRCERVAPLARFTDYTDPAATLTFTPAE